MAKQTVTAFFDDRESANNAVLLLRRYASADRDVTVSPEAAATGHPEEMPAHVTRFWARLGRLFGGSGDYHTYAEGVRRGVTLVTVHVDEAQIENVVAVLGRHGSIDMSERESAWRADGWTGGSAVNGSMAGPHPRHKIGPMSQAQIEQAAACVLATPSARDAYLSSAMPAKTQPVNRGKVRIHPYETVTPVEQQASGLDTSANVHRRPVDQPVAAADIGHGDQVDNGGGQTPAATSASLSQTSTVQRARGLEVVGSDGQHVGTIDFVEGTTIKLQRLDPAFLGTHHLIPTEWVRSIDEKLTLKLTAAEARSRWTIG